MKMRGLAKTRFAMKPDRDGFEDTFLPHFDAAYNVARWITRDPSDAEDVVQEAFLRAFKFFDGFHGGDSKAWILRIVRNTCYTWLHKNRPQDIVYELVDDICDHLNGNPESKFIENVERELLRSGIDELPAPFKEVIVLRDIEGLSYKEIAAVIELPVGTVMSRLARGRERLHKILGVQPTGGRI